MSNMTLKEFENYFNDVICENLNIILSFLNDGDTFLDIGANTGLLSEQILKTKKLNKLILIEPVERYYKECVRKFKKNSSVEIEQVGFSDVSEIKEIYCSTKNYGYNKIYVTGMEIHPHYVEKINCIRFDEWVGDRKFNFIKIDAEGHDTNIIYGMINWLDKIDEKPFIFFEGGWYDNIENNLIKFLENTYDYNTQRYNRDILMIPPYKNKII